MRGAGLLQDGADDGAAQDDDADAGHDAAKAVLDGGHHVGRGLKTGGAGLVEPPAQARCDYLLYSAAIRDADFLEELYARLGDAFRESELPLLFQTAECYYRHGRSVTQAASELFIHKNTLQYRVRRLLEALELERCGPFQEEFLMRLLLEHHKRKQSRQALE